MLIFFDVDTQKDFMNKDGALYVPGAEAIKSNIQKLTEKAKNNDIPIFSTVDIHDNEDKEFIDNGGIFPKHCIRHSVGADKIDESISDNYKLQTIFPKKTYDIFDIELGNKDIDAALKGVTTAVVYGVATDICVDAAIIGLLKRGIIVSLVIDATKSIDIKAFSEKSLEWDNLGAWSLVLTEIVIL